MKNTKNNLAQVAVLLTIAFLGIALLNHIITNNITF